jgi:hypothetical protein
MKEGDILVNTENGKMIAKMIIELESNSIKDTKLIQILVQD